MYYNLLLLIIINLDKKMNNSKILNKSQINAEFLELDIEKIKNFMYNVM